MEILEIFDQLVSPEFHKFLNDGLCEAYDCSECPFLKECYHKGGASRIYLTREEFLRKGE